MPLSAYRTWTCSIYSCKIAYMDYLQRWTFFFSFLISGEGLLAFGGGAER